MRNNCGLCKVDCDVLGPHLKGGEVCWQTDGTCKDGQCGITTVCEPGQVCSVANTGLGDVPICSTPVNVTQSLFDFAAQQGSFSGLFLAPETHLACNDANDCLATQICFKDCAFELKATTGGTWGASSRSLSIPGFAQPGQGAACTKPGVCSP